MKDTQLNTYRAAPRWMFLKTNTDEDLGRDPARIQDRWQTLYRVGFDRG